MITGTQHTGNGRALGTIEPDALKEASGTQERMAAKATVRVLCATEQPLVLQGLAACIEGSPDLELVGCATRCDAMAAHLEESDVDVLVLDLALGGGEPFECLREVKAVRPEVGVVVIADRLRDCDVEMALDCGALGIFSKRDSIDALMRGVRLARAGATSMGERAKERCAAADVGSSHASAGHNGARTRLTLLTPREREVVRMIGRGLGRTDIAAAMHRSPKTVDCHRASALKKLELDTTVELARYAIREGLAEA